MTTDLGEYSLSLTDRPLGKGSYATVFKGVEKSTKQDVAVKVIEYDMRGDVDKKYLDQELLLHAQMKHPNVIELKHKQKLGTKFFVVLEFCAGGDLKGYLDEQKQKRLSEDVAKHFMCQFASALQYLHDQGIVHRDIKPQNILLSEKSGSARVKLADFGFARKVDPSDEMLSILGSPLYMAPEVILQKPYKMKSDLWSVGLVFFEMLSGRLPFSPRTVDELKTTLSDGQPVNFSALPPEISPGCRDLLKGLLQKQPSQRFNWDQFFGHTYLQAENLSQSLVASRSFFLKVVSFFPHGQLTTVYFPPSETFGQLKQKISMLNDVDDVMLVSVEVVTDAILAPTTGYPPNKQALFDKHGILLEDDVTVESLGFHKSKEEVLIYLVPWDLMDAQQVFNVPPYTFASVTPVPVLPTVFSSKYHAIKEKHAAAVKISEAMRSAKADIGLCKQHYEHQVRVAGAVKMYLTRTRAQLSGALVPVIELFNTCNIQAPPLVKDFEAILKELGSTKVNLKKGEPAKTMLEILGEPVIRKDFHDLEVLLKDLPTSKGHLEMVVAQAGEKADAAVAIRLVEKIPDGLSKCVDDINKICESTKKRLTELESNFRQLQPKAMQPDFEKKESTTIDYYFRVFQHLETDYKRVSEITKLAAEAKTKGSQQLIQHLQLVGPCNLEIGYANSILDQFQKTLDNMLVVISKVDKHSKAAQGFKEAIAEVHRRKQFRQHLLLFCQKGNTHFEELYTAEITKRQAFQHLWGRSLLPHVCPYLIRSEEHETKVPMLHLTVPEFDSDLPEVPSETMTPDDLEDDFAFLTVGDPNERVKALELERLALMKKVADSLLVPNLTTTEVYQRLSELEKENKTIKEQTAGKFVSLEQTEMLKKENELLNANYKEQVKIQAEEKRLVEEKERKIQELRDTLARAQAEIRDLTRAQQQQQAQPQPKPQPQPQPKPQPQIQPQPQQVPQDQPPPRPHLPPTLPTPNPGMAQAQEIFKGVVATLCGMGFTKDDVVAAYQRVPINTPQNLLVQTILNELLGVSQRL